MRDKLWIIRWNKKRKISAVKKQKIGENFISQYIITDFKKVLSDLWEGFDTDGGNKTSKYVTFISPNGQETIKVRISDHPSNEYEWSEKELTGLPNRRYSIVIFSNKSMPNEFKENIKELNWKNYFAQNIPVYEKAFNRFYLSETFEKLKSILLGIYQGYNPEDNTLSINTN